MSIACLGWGSLIWKPGTLEALLGDSPWNKDGPWLSIEFARESKKSGVSLALESGAQPCQALWALLKASSLQEAREALRQREGCPKIDCIGYWSTGDRTPGDVSNIVGSWAVEHNLDGVVWTALPPKWNGQKGVVPTIDQVLERLRSWGAGSEAERYVRRAPSQVRTAYRARIEADLGWTYQDESAV